MTTSAAGTQRKWGRLKNALYQKSIGESFNQLHVARGWGNALESFDQVQISGALINV